MLANLSNPTSVFPPTVLHNPGSVEVEWMWLLVICVPGILGMMWFSWRLHRSINRCKVPEDALIPQRSKKAVPIHEKYD